MHGVMHTNSSILFFCDADLIGLNAEHIRALIEPVARGACAMCIGLRDRGFLLDWLQSRLPLISGARVLRRSLFESVPDSYLQGYMLETALNYFCRLHGESICVRKLAGLHVRRKMQKVGILIGLYQYLRMVMELMRAFILVRTAGWKGEL